MIACVDVDYRDASVSTACVGFDVSTDVVARHESVMTSTTTAAAYAPGEFYKRELPYLLSILQPLIAELELELVIVDGYVWLAAGQPGLGAHLHAALAIPVIGVAKSRFAGADALEITRGISGQALYITAIGIEREPAAAHIRTMHGPFRIPTLLKRVDQIARGVVSLTS